MLLAQIPQTARVNKKEAKAPDVAFQGDPQFTPIETTTGAARGEHRQGRLQGRRSVLHVLPGRVVRRQDRFRSLGGGQSVPEQIYQIPVSSPAHHVTYVTIEEDDDDDWVTMPRRPATPG